MEWTRSVDGYCERVDPSFWAEPVNAVTNIAFLIAACVMARRLRGHGLPIASALVWVLAAIGVSSFLFHTFALVWAGVADSVSIMVFVLIYIWAANRHFWDLPAWGAGLLTAAYIPYSVALVWVFSGLPLLEISSFYWPLPVLIAAYAILLRRRFQGLAAGLAIGASILSLSLVLRSLDEIVCTAAPLGTHFAWHLLNAIMLGWMIEVYRRHMVATGRAAV